VIFIFYLCEYCCKFNRLNERSETDFSLATMQFELDIIKSSSNNSVNISIPNTVEIHSVVSEMDNVDHNLHSLRSLAAKILIKN
jgi:hypothetical protein